MDILFVVPYVPTLIRVRPYNLIRSLSERGNRVTVATVWTNDQEREDLNALRTICHRVIAVRQPAWRSYWNCLKALPSNIPLQSVYSWAPSLIYEISQAAASNGKSTFDAIHVEHLRGARYGVELKAVLGRNSARPPIVWDSVDSITLLFQQAMTRSRSVFSRGITRLELGRTERFEGWLVRQFERVLVTSPNDRQALLSLAAPDEAEPAIQVLPNGVDLDYFKPGDESRRQPATLVVSGKMSYHANVAMVLHLAQDILPKVWDQCPEARLVIVGKDPAASIQELAKDSRVTVTGTVEDVRPYLQQATLAVAPIAYGAGIQNKVLEAMACATPVIASPQAVSALNLIAGQEALVASDAVGFSEAILSLLDRPDLGRQIGQAGRKYIEDQHDWTKTAANLEEIYQDAAAGPRIAA